MAKKRAKGDAPTKAEAVRTEFNSRGLDTRVVDVINALKEKGINVSSAQVSTIRKKMGGKSRRRRRRGAAAATATAKASRGVNLSLDALLNAKGYVEKMGGLDRARKMLDALAKLQ